MFSPEFYSCSEGEVEPLNQSAKKLKSNMSDQAFEFYLISLVRKAKILYCSDNPDYNNTAKKRLQWLMIAEKCKRSVPQCISRWHYLLRTYFSSSRETYWIHRADFLCFEPYLSQHKLQKPTTAQKSILFKYLLAHSSQLTNYKSRSDENDAWLEIVAKCNEVTPGVIMSKLNWQKYWVKLKQNFGAHLYKAPSTFAGQNSDEQAMYTNDELTMIKICGAQPSDSFSNILSALGNNLELGPIRKRVILKCNKCQKQKDEILLNGCCSNCFEKPRYCNICQIGDCGIKYKLSTWSKAALKLLPIKLMSLQEISVCSSCSNKLKQESSSKWRVCRCCQVASPNLESLYTGKYNNSLRKAFKDATNYNIKENDGLPGFICRTCKIQLIKLTAFFNKFKRTQTQLMNIHLENFIGDYDDNSNSEQEDQPTTKPIRNHERPKETVSPENITESGIVDDEEALEEEIVPFPIIPATKAKSEAENDSESEEESIDEPIYPMTIVPANALTSELATKDVCVLQKKQSVEVSKSSSPPSVDNVYPTNIIASTKATGVRIRNLQELISERQKLGHTSSTNLKPSATKPAIFTINVERTTEPDLETPQIPSEVFSLSESMDDVVDITASPSKIIKIEDDDDDDDDDYDDILAKKVSIPNVNKPTFDFISTAQPRSVVQLTGPLASVRSHPYIRGASESVHPAGQVKALKTNIKDDKTNQEGIKISRKYWGNVDEFQVSPSLTVKNLQQLRD